MLIDCEGCSNKFIKKAVNQIFCSNECRISHYRRKSEEKRKGKAVKKCKSCDKVFEYDAGKQSSKKYCTETCREKYYKKNNFYSKKNEDDYLKRVVTFRVSGIIEKSKYTEPATSLGFIISEFTLDTFSEVIKKSVLERDDYKCRVCECRNERLEVHHILKRKLGGTNDIDNLITLCVDCHRAIDTGDEKYAIGACFNKAKNLTESDNGISNTEKINSLRFALEDIFETISEDEPFEKSEMLIKINEILVQTV